MKIDFKKSPRVYFWFLLTVATVVGVVFFVQPQTFSFQLENKQIKVAEEKKPEPLVLLFGGDIFLDRSIRRTIEAKGRDFIWQNIAEFLKSYKYKVANLEGPIVNKSEAAPTGSFNFAFQEEYINQLKLIGFTALSLANNHTDNAGAVGLSNTRTVLETLGIGYFGDPRNIGELSFAKYVYVEDQLIPENEFTAAGRNLNVDDHRVAFVGEHDLVALGQARILEIIKELDDQGYFVIALPHWGPEYVLTIPKVERNRAHALIEAGADLIIGSHPHVIQPIEVYQGRVIFYSLGNFLFDQWFSYDTLHGLLVAVTWEENSLRFKLYPTEQNKDFQIGLAPGEEKTKILDRLRQNSVGSDEVRLGIAAGEFTIAR